MVTRAAWPIMLEQGQLTAEAIDAAWDRIGDFSGAQHPSTIQDTFASVFGNLGITT